MSTHFNLSGGVFHVGETIVIEVACFDAAGEPLDLTGATIVFRLASRSAKLLDVTNGAGVTVVNIDNGFGAGYFAALITGRRVGKA